MNLLVVTQYYHPEPFRITEICEELVKLGHTVHVMTSVPNVPSGQFYEGYGWFKYGEKERNGVTIERVNVVKRGNNSSFRWALNCASYVFNSFFHLPGLKKRKFDAVFVFNNSPITSIIPAIFVSKSLKIPLSVWVLDIWPESLFFLIGKSDGQDGLFKKISRLVCSWIYRKADTLLISSKGFEQKLRALGAKGRIEYFPNFAEKPAPSDKSFEREDFGFSEDDFVIGFAGNVGLAQGLEYTVDATLAANKSHIKWLIVGDGPSLPSLKAKVSDCSLDDSYFFTGWVSSSDVPAYLGVSDALLVTLKDQEVLNLTVPAKLQTYMSIGKPVIAFMNGAGADTVKEADCGISAKAEDVNELCSAISTISSLSKDEVERMGFNGKAFCAEHFERDMLIRRLETSLSDSIKTYAMR